MNRARSVLVSPVIGLLVAALVLYLLAVSLAPDAAARWLASDGPVDQVGRVAALIALLAWLVIAECGIVMERISLGVTALAMLVTTSLAFLFFDSIEWGGAYGVDLGHSVVVAVTGGASSLREATIGAGGISWALLAMMFPLALLFSVGLIPRRGRRARAPARPTWEESVRFWIIVAVAGLAGTYSPAPAFGYFQIVLSALWASVGVRALRELFRPGANGGADAAAR